MRTEGGEGETRGRAPRRIALLAAFALSSTIAAMAAIMPSTDAELLLAKTASAEPVAIRLEEGLLPAPASYVREDRLLRGDTFQGLFARLAIAEADAKRLKKLHALRRLRAGSIVTAEVRAGNGHEGELVWLGFLAAGDVAIRIERVGEGLVTSERRAQVEARSVLKSALIRSSLFAAADVAESDPVTLALPSGKPLGR